MREREREASDVRERSKLGEKERRKLRVREA